MVDPISIGLEATTVAELSMGASAAGGIMGGIGKIMGGMADSSMYKYQASIAAVNKQIAEQNAEYAREVGETEAQKKGMEDRARISNTVAAQSGSGTVVGTGSNAKVVNSEGQLAQYDQSLIRANAAKRAYGYEVEALQADEQNQLMKSASSKSMTAGIVGGIGSFIGTAGSVATKWMQGSQIGLWGGGDTEPNIGLVDDNA